MSFQFGYPQITQSFTDFLEDGVDAPERSRVVGVAGGGEGFSVFHRFDVGGLEGECGQNAAGVGLEGGSGQAGVFAGVGHSRIPKNETRLYIYSDRWKVSIHTIDRPFWKSRLEQAWVVG